MAVVMLIGAVYGVWQLAVLSSLTRTVRVSVLFLALAVGLYGAGLLSVLLQLLYTHSVAALTDTPLREVIRTASYTVDPLIEELIKVLPLALLVLLHKRIRQQWGVTDYVLVGAATGAGFTLTEALLRFSEQASNVEGNPVAGWSQASGFTLIHFPGLPDILTSWVPAPVAFGDAFEAIAGVATNPHLVLSALAGLGVGLLMRGQPVLRLAGAGLIFYAWLDHATYNYRVGAPGGRGFVSMMSGPMEFFNKGEWLYPLLALAVATYFDYEALKAGRLAAADVQTRASLTGFAAKRLPWTALIAWRFTLIRRNLYFAKTAGAKTEDLHGLVRAIRDQVDSSNPQAWRGLKLKPPAGKRSYWPILISLILLVPGLLYFVVGTFPLTAGAQELLVSPVVTPLVLAMGFAAVLWLAWQIVVTARSLPRQYALPLADPIARGDLRLVNGCGAIVVGVVSLAISVTGTGLDGPLFDDSHILEALGRATSLCGLALMLMALLLLLFPPGGGLALAGAGALGGAGALSPGALGALGAALGAAGLLMSSGGGKDADYWEDKYGDEGGGQPRTERISDGNKQELQESGWLKQRVPDVNTRREFMKWLEQGHKQGEPHTHLRPGSPEAEAALEEFLATLL